MFDPRSWARLGGLLFTAKMLVDGLHVGGHPSARHGAGVAFHDYRPYVPGDDIAAVDWKLFGRTDRYYLRRDRRDSDLHLQLLVDISASMDFASLDGPREGRPTKLTIAKQLAAAMAFLAVRQGDRVGLAVGADRLSEVLPVQGGWPHLQRVCATLERASSSAGLAGDAGACLRELHALRRRPGLVVVLSDLLDEPGPMLDGVSRLRHARCDATLFQVLSPDELSLPQRGSARGWRRLVDAESSRSADVPPAGVGPSYDRRLVSHLTAVRSACQARGAGYQLVRTDQPVLAALRQYLAQRAAASWFRAT